MSETVVTTPRPSPQRAENSHKPARKTQPGQFPYRITMSMAPDQVAALAAAKRRFRASEAFCLRLAWDAFAQAHGLFPVDPNGANNG